jgi:membrane protein DedA with SNARE-associated domain
VKQWLIVILSSTVGLAAYSLVFLILLAAGFGLPLPEDIPLVMGGVLAYRGQADLWMMIFVGYFGIVLGDSVMFALGRRFGRNVGSKPPTGFFSRIATPAARARVEGLFKKHGEKIVMVARFLPGIRTVTYFTAGSVGMKYVRFIVYDSIAALASAPIFVVLGYRYGEDIESLLTRIASGERNVMLGLLAIILSVVLFGRWRSRREKRAEAEALQKQLETQVIEPPSRVS